MPAPLPSINAALPDLLRDYQPLAGAADELMQADGTLRPVWQPLIDLLASQTSEQIASRTASGNQYLADAGVFFRQYTDAGSTERVWPLSHVPVVISADEWRGLTDGIIQRAELLETVMADLYGPGNLVAEGLLPPDLVAGNPEWLRPLVGTRPRSGHYLHFLAFELGRSPDGSWFVLADRTQAPSGAGFALENRVATTRVFHDLFPQANVERLAGFFRNFRNALNGLRSDGEGRVAILTPGLATDSYFEHAYIAKYLGFMLLESEDLRVERGRLIVRTVAGPEPIDVLWRRLESRFADPLELDETSALGTPGMVRAVRDGALTMANFLGSGVLEARAFLAFLPHICEVKTGQPLKLPNIATWWCGQQKERNFVRKNVERMMIGSALSARVPFDIDTTTFLGGSFRGTALPSVEDWIMRDAGKLVGQEAVTLSTTPALIDGRLVPRPMTLRVFAARTPDGWSVMPGGYARIGRTEDPTALSMRAGGSVADVWVIGDAPVQVDTLTTQSEGPFVRRMPGILPSRAADNLYWLGRYVERAESTVRKVRSFNLRFTETANSNAPLLQALVDHCEHFGTDVTEPVPANLLHVLDASLGCAGRVRDRLSTDGWLALTDLARTAHDMAGRAKPGDDAVRAMGVLLRKLAGFAGLVHDNMFHFTGWRFLSVGRALERAAHMSAFLADFADTEAPVGGFDLAVEVGDSVMSHRRRYAVETNRNTVIDLLGLDIDNPRSVLFQFEQIRQQAELLPKARVNGQMSPLLRSVLSLHTELSVADPSDIDTDRLVAMREQIAEMSNTLNQMYLS